jgi:hypothetical protein
LVLPLPKESSELQRSPNTERDEESPLLSHNVVDALTMVGHDFHAIFYVLSSTVADKKYFINCHHQKD